MRDITFGVILPQSVPDYAIVRNVALECERLDYDSIWLNDHLYEGWLSPEEHMHPYLDCWTLLPALAVETKMIRIGSLVTSNTFRHPSLLAKMATTLDIISAGRLEFGIGAGDLPIEHYTYGIPYPSDRERILRLREALQVIIKIWTEEKPSFTGKFYEIREPPCFPKPIQKPHPPIWVGSITGRKRVIRLATEFADNFNVLNGSPESYAEKMKTLDDYCWKIGRKPSSIRRSWHGFIDAAIKKDDSLIESTIRSLKAMLDAGVQDFILGFSDRTDIEALKIFAEQIVPALK